MIPPSGTVTFLFTDIEGSTRLWEQSPGAMRGALARHNVLMHQSIVGHHGLVFKTLGDAFCAAFATAPQALMAAFTAQQALQKELWPEPLSIRVRMAIHTGSADERDGDYFGPPLNRVSRLLATAHGGQTLLSQPTYELTRDALPAQCSLLDLGAHALRDLARPEQVYQLCQPDLPSEFPPLKSLDSLPNNLPQQLTSFIGRERELDQVKALLAKTRLLTLTGSGGCGKTRLSLQVAADELDAFPDGVWLIELAPLTDPELIPQVVMSVFGVKESPGQSILQALTTSLKSKTLLLILDNCEHVLAACAKLAADLMRACPNVRILATSREALNVIGEQTYRVPSLSLPDPKQKATAESLSQYEAVRLFIERTTLVKPDFAVTNANAPAVASICHRVDGIPLALELAAARVRSLSVEEINSRLDNRFRLLTGGSKTALPRQQTLRALIDWSYNLLTEQEKDVLICLSVFAGGWTLAAAESVCAGEDIEDWEVLDLLTSLSDKSLVSSEEGGGQTRYRMIETVRQYARDRLFESGRSVEIRERHQAYFLSLAEQASPKMIGADQLYWLSTLEIEHDNFRQALTFGLDHPEAIEMGMKLGAALHVFWEMRGYLREGRERLTLLLSCPEAQAHTKSRAEALNALGRLARTQGDNNSARAFAEESLSICRELGDRQGIALSLNALGVVALYQDDYPLARTHFEASLEIRRELGDRKGIAGSLHNLGNVARGQDNYPLARSLFEESLSIYRELDDKLGSAFCLNSLGRLAKDEGDHRSARSRYEERLAISREIGDRYSINNSVHHLGALAYMLGDYAEARSLHQESLDVARELGDRGRSAGALNNVGGVAVAQGDYPAANALFEESLNIYRELGDKSGIAFSLDGLGEIACLHSDYPLARSLHQESLTLRQAMGDKGLIAGSLENLGVAAQWQGDYVTAQSLLQESLGIYRELGNRWGVANVLINLGELACIISENTPARFYIAESLEIYRKLGIRKGIAGCLEAFAALAVNEEKWDRSARLFGAADALREVLGAPLPPNYQARHEQRMTAARQAIGEEAFTVAWSEGRTMPIEQAAQYALEYAASARESNGR